MPDVGSNAEQSVTPTAHHGEVNVEGVTEQSTGQPRGGFMTAEDEAKEQQLQTRTDKQSLGANDTARLSVDDAPTSDQPDALADDTILNLTAPLTRTGATSPGRLTVMTDKAVRQREVPESRSSPPPTPPAKSSASSTGTLPFKRRAGGATSPASSAMHRLTTSSASESPDHIPSSSNLLSAGSPTLKRSPLPPTPANSPAKPNKVASSVPRKRSLLPGSSNDEPLRNHSAIRRKSPTVRLSPETDVDTEAPQASTSALTDSPDHNAGPSSPTSSSSDTVASSSPSSSPVKLAQATTKSLPRRVKVYALYDSNWIDLGTGSCTYHRGLALVRGRDVLEDRKGKKPESQAGNEAAENQDSSTRSISIAGLASRQKLMPSVNNDIPQSDLAEKDVSDDTEDEIELVELPDGDDRLQSDGWPTDDLLNSLVGEEGEAAWIEVRKEGRWKTDSAASEPDKGDDNSEKEPDSEEADAEKLPSNTNIPNIQSVDEQWEKVWTTRIEKPDTHGRSGADEWDMYSPQLGAEEGEEVIGRYRRQQDTLIVWKSAFGGTELALSFAATAGCAEIWEFLKEVHLRWETQLFDAHHMEDAVELDQSPRISDGDKLTNGLGVTSGVIQSNGPSTAALLPDPTLSNIETITQVLRSIARTAAGREKLSAFVLRTHFVEKLFPIFRESEDLEDLDGLHDMCILMHSVLNLNDHTLWDYILSDEIFWGVIDILEYDPDFGTMKAVYKTHLSDPSNFVQIVPIDHANTLAKIHEVYRLQYLKDVVLPRSLDDSAFSSVNSFIYFHQVDIVQYLNSQAAFWKSVFDIFPSSKIIKIEDIAKAAGDKDDASLDSWSKAIAFIQAYCHMVKQLQPQMRGQSYRTLADRGLHRVVEFALARLAQHKQTRIAVVEILMLILEHDPSSLRSYVLKQADSSKTVTFLSHLISAFHMEKDLGVKAQLCEALRILLMPASDGSAPETLMARARPDDPNIEKFLQHFYEAGVSQLLEPITSLDMRLYRDFEPHQLALQAHLSDLLCFFVSHHSFRSKFFILSSSVTKKMTLMLHAEQKHIRLAALRFFRACIGRSDDFYNRYLIKNGAFSDIIDLAKIETQADNLLASACLDLFEYLRRQNAKLIIKHIMDTYKDDIVSLSHSLAVFSGLVVRWEQNNEPPPTSVAGNTSGADTVNVETANASPRRDKTLSDEEDSYFATEDDNDSDKPGDSSAATPIVEESSRRLSPPSLSLKVQDDSDDEEDLLRHKRLRTAGDTDVSTAQRLPSPVGKDAQNDSTGGHKPMQKSMSGVARGTDPEAELSRLREKRKREDDMDTDIISTLKSASNGSDKKIMSSKKNAPPPNRLRLVLDKK